MTAPPPEPAALAALERLEDRHAGCGYAGDPLADLALLRAALARHARLVALISEADAAINDCAGCIHAAHSCSAAWMALRRAALDAPEGAQP